MGCESFSGVRFDLRPLLQGQTRAGQHKSQTMAGQHKSGYISLIIGSTPSTFRKPYAVNLFPIDRFDLGPLL